jgi:hypothetical protein
MAGAGAFGVAGAGAVALVVTLALSLRATAQDAGTLPPPPLVLHYTFQPECLRQSATAPCDTPRASKRLDLGPQIAVWVEKADGSFVDTLMVTNAVAVRGIGNRPGYWRFPSNWHFPYGKRQMALPVWAHARGRTYDTLVIQDDDGSGREGGGEMALGFHEQVSSPDPYYCLTFRPATWVFEVDAISCPTGMFNSAKGRFQPDLPKSYYPPRNDLTTFGVRDCDQISAGSCMKTSARDFSTLNDLDAVAAATPPYDRPYLGTWMVPADLPEGPYVLAVEVNKEFDTNAAHMHEAFQDQALPENGLRNNFGQPSVVWKVPFQLDRSKPQQAAAMEIAGSGDWDGATGTLHPPGADISDGLGTGRGRLRALTRPAMAGGAPVLGRVHVSTELVVATDSCGALPPGNGEIADLTVPKEGITDRDARVEFTEPGDRGQPVQQYEIRYLVGKEMTLETFLQATPATAWVPQKPGTHASIRITELKPSVTYTVGARVRGGCVKDGPPVTATFTTTPPAFKQLHGCFIATAAYGSALEPQVAAIRRLRDRARGDALAAVSIGLYERSSPPLAALLGHSETGRALVRAALSPIAALVTDAERLQR